MFATLPISARHLAHMSPCHPYSSTQHVSSPRSAHFHLPTSPVFLGHKGSDNGIDLPHRRALSNKRHRPSASLTPDQPQRPSKRARTLLHHEISGERPLSASHPAAQKQTDFALPCPLPSIDIASAHTATSTSILDMPTATTPPLSINTSATPSPDSSPSSSPPAEMPPVASTSTSPRRTASPPSLPPVLCMKRPNPKRLSLALPSNPMQPAPIITTSNIVTPTNYYGQDTSSTDSTPYTPGPPKTPALAMSASVGRAATKAFRRPSLLSLITQPSPTSEDVPPTPSAGPHPYAISRPRIRTRSSTSSEASTSSSYDKDYKSAHPSYRTFPPIHEHGSLPSLDFAYKSSSSPITSDDASPSTSNSASTSTTPSSSPPLATTSLSTAFAYPSRPVEPYSDAPIEMIPNVFLGAENSATDLAWARGRPTLRIINVAQEIEDPFCRGDVKGKGKVKVANYPAEGYGMPDIEYCHLRWSHGEGGLADIPQGATLAELIEGPRADPTAETWGLWNAVRWLEAARRGGIPVLIHCQCGISRSATLVVAYLMCLAAAGLAPEYLGHLKGMQDTYDFVKRKSPCIGPNVSLVFQLVEFQRSLTTLLSQHIETHPPTATSFPTLADVSLSEAEWAKKRREFEIDEEAEDQRVNMLARGGVMLSPLSPEEAGDEARRLDQAMIDRLRTRD